MIVTEINHLVPKKKIEDSGSMNLKKIFNANPNMVAEKIASRKLKKDNIQNEPIV
jgi:hypothetical protein